MWFATVPVFRGALLVASIAQTALSQTILPSAPSAQFPACAFACTALQNAAATCLPPAAAVSNQATYNSCFCQSSILAPLKTSPHGVCDAQCPAESDLDTLQTWYNNYCNNGGTTTTTTANAGVVTTLTTSTITPTPGTSTSSSSSNSVVTLATASASSIPSSDSPNQSQPGW